MPPVTVVATLRGDREALLRALNDGSNVDQTDAEGRSALHHACIIGNTDFASLLLASNADANLADRNGWRPLHFAANDYHVEVAELLLKAGAQVDSEDDHGNTPLFRATFASQGRGNMISLLRQHGAQPSHANKHGVSPIALAMNIANYDIAQWLR